jgi:hypothetical protein
MSIPWQPGTVESQGEKIYYEVIGAGWHSSLAALKHHLEAPRS